MRPQPIRRPPPKPPAPAPVPVPAPAPIEVPKPAYQTGLVRAALVGINYLRTPYELTGCINDVNDMQTLLKQLYPGCKEYSVITDQTDVKPTRANILTMIDWLVKDLKPGQNVYFHFSGHGGRVRDTNGDEVTNMDSCIYPCNRGVMETITDDELRTLLAARVPAGCKAFVVLDCCHSGTAVDLRYLWAAPSATSLSYSEDKKYAALPGTVVFLSGCQDAQVAADTADGKGRPCGALTMALRSTWTGYGAAIKTKYLLWDVRKFLRDRGYTQVPQLSTGSKIDPNQVLDLGKA
jgi:metacaspase-1